jgi:L-ascorbate metabolism protein UlaG (beta-lactamase superfamily)
MNLAANKKIGILVFSLIILCLIGATVAGCASVQGTLGTKEPLSSTPKPAIETPVSITWFGLTAFKLTCQSKSVLIDPWITDNPQSLGKLEDTYPADIILISDGDNEHVGDSVAIAERTGAKVVTTPQIATKLQWDGLPTENIIYEGSGINIGGEVVIEGITIIMTEAMHSSQTGSPTGYIIKFPGGATIYFAGDTGIFANMQVYGELYPIHVALLPIGGVVTMDAYQAVKSLQLLNPSTVIPMRFGTFPNLAPNADVFVKLAKQEALGTEVVVLKPGQSYILKPRVFNK